MLDATAAELQQQVARLSRCEVSVHSLEALAALILVCDADEACAITDLIAPEHLHIATDNAELLPFAKRFSWNERQSNCF